MGEGVILGPDVEDALLHATPHLTLGVPPSALETRLATAGEVVEVSQLVDLRLVLGVLAGVSLDTATGDGAVVARAASVLVPDDGAVRLAVNAVAGRIPRRVAGRPSPLVGGVMSHEVDAAATPDEEVPARPVPLGVTDLDQNGAAWLGEATAAVDMEDYPDNKN